MIVRCISSNYVAELAFLEKGAYFKIKIVLVINSAMESFFY